MHISPDFISIIRGMLGIAGGVFFCTGIKEYIWWGAFLFLVSTIFDCADGQLARILKRQHARLGIILDGVGDGITIFSIYLGTAIALYSQNPNSVFYWWGLTILAVFSFLFSLQIHGFLKFDFFFYSTPHYANTRESSSELREKIRSSKRLKDKAALSILFMLNYVIELQAKLVLLKNYKGYLEWYMTPNAVSLEKKELFRKNYKKYNGWILLLFNNLGIGSNQLLIIICGFFNRLDMAIYIIVIISNLYLVICILIQRISFQYQVNKIK